MNSLAKSGTASPALECIINGILALGPGAKAIIPKGEKGKAVFSKCNKMYQRFRAVTSSANEEAIMKYFPLMSGKLVKEVAESAQAYEAVEQRVVKLEERTSKLEDKMESVEVRTTAVEDEQSSARLEQSSARERQDRLSGAQKLLQAQLDMHKKSAEAAEAQLEAQGKEMEEAKARLKAQGKEMEEAKADKAAAAAETTELQMRCSLLEGDSDLKNERIKTLEIDSFELMQSKEKMGSEIEALKEKDQKKDELIEALQEKAMDHELDKAEMLGLLAQVSTQLDGVDAENKAEIELCKGLLQLLKMQVEQQKEEMKENFEHYMLREESDDKFHAVRTFCADKYTEMQTRFKNQSAKNQRVRKETNDKIELVNLAVGAEAEQRAGAIFEVQMTQTAVGVAFQHLRDAIPEALATTRDAAIESATATATAMVSKETEKREAQAQKMEKHVDAIVEDVHERFDVIDADLKKAGDETGAVAAMVNANKVITKTQLAGIDERVSKLEDPPEEIETEI